MALPPSRTLLPQSQTDQEDMDPFSPIHDLETTIYTQAYQLGVSDGSSAGRIEGRIFGLEKGFEKFLSLGRLAGRSAVWSSRLPPVGNFEQPKEMVEEEQPKAQLPKLPAHPRLKSHIHMLSGLSELETFSTLNTEEAVADFDDRVKRAGAKCKVIERIVGEEEFPSKSTVGIEQATEGSERGNAGVEERGRNESNYGELEIDMGDFMATKRNTEQPTHPVSGKGVSTQGKPSKDKVKKPNMSGVKSGSNSQVSRKNRANADGNSLEDFRNLRNLEI